MGADPWNPEQYQRFRAERGRPFEDLLRGTREALGDRPAPRVADLGCGTGETTARLHRELAARETEGLDSSRAMLDQARAHGAPGLTFRDADVGGAPPGKPYDVVFSNACLHWIDDHPALFARLLGAWVVPGGLLAVQVPANHHHTSHTVAARIAGEEPFRSALGGWVRRSPVLEPRAYAELLDALGCTHQEVLCRVYPHNLPSRDEVVEWVKGTTLTAYRRRLPEPDYAAFLARYRDALLAELEDARPFFFPFPRVLLWARAPG